MKISNQIIAGFKKGFSSREISDIKFLCDNLFSNNKLKLSSSLIIVDIG